MTKPTPCEHPKGFKTSVQIGKEYCSFCGESREEKPTPRRSVKRSSGVVSIVGLRIVGLIEL
jgi:hypothetical protein